MLALTNCPCAITKEGAMKLLMAIVALTCGMLPVDTVSASCRCVCMNGEVRAVCSSTLDIEPVCPPRVCPIVPPSVEPIQRPKIPPVGTSSCVQKQIYNEYTRRYEWKEVCY